MRFLRKHPTTLKPELLRAKALAAGKLRANLNVGVFILDPTLPAEELAILLTGQFEELSLVSTVSVAGPERVPAAMTGYFKDADVLLVLGDSSSQTEPALMELVQWLLLNGQKVLAETLLFVQLGADKKGTPAPAFERVILPLNFAQKTQQSGLRLPRAAVSHEPWELTDAILTYATGLAAE